MSEPELKPCPFCRKAPGTEQGYSDGRKPLRTWAVCGTLGCAIEGLEILAEKWNTRADSVERLRATLLRTAKAYHGIANTESPFAECKSEICATARALAETDSSQGEEK